MLKAPLLLVVAGLAVVASGCEKSKPEVFLAQESFGGGVNWNTWADMLPAGQEGVLLAEVTELEVVPPTDRPTRAAGLYATVRVLEHVVPMRTAGDLAGRFDVGAVDSGFMGFVQHGDGHPHPFCGGARPLEVGDTIVAFPGTVYAGQTRDGRVAPGLGVAFAVPCLTNGLVQFRGVNETGGMVESFRVALPVFKQVVQTLRGVQVNRAWSEDVTQRCGRMTCTEGCFAGVGCGQLTLEAPIPAGATTLDGRRGAEPVLVPGGG